MIKRFAVLLSAAVAITGCSGPAQTFEIDNPGATPLTLRIDGNELPIAAHASRPVKLKPGEHHLQTEQLGDVRFIVYASGKGGLINPTLAEYVIANEIYVTGDDKLQHFGSLKNQIALGGVTFEGPYQATHDLFIDQAWSFGVREPFPEVQTVSHVDASGGRINTKIFTAPDFIAYVEAGMGQPGAYARQQPKGYMAPSTHWTPRRPPCPHWIRPSKPMPARCASCTAATCRPPPPMRSCSSSRRPSRPRWRSPPRRPRWARACPRRPTRATTPSCGPAAR